jgi:hypothetical protein
MIFREIIMWLSIMRSNLKDFSEVGSDNKIKALSEALVIIHKYEKIEQIVKAWNDMNSFDSMTQISEVLEDAKNQ